MSLFCLIFMRAPPRLRLNAGGRPGGGDTSRRPGRWRYRGPAPGRTASPAHNRTPAPGAGCAARRLDTFGYRGHPQGSRQGDNRRDNFGVFLVGPQAADKRPVNLQRVRRHAVQVAQRGVADAEIINADLHAQRFDPGQRRRRLAFRHQRIFHNLQLQLAGGQAGFRRAAASGGRSGQVRSGAGPACSRSWSEAAAA